MVTAFPPDSDKDQFPKDKGWVIPPVTGQSTCSPRGQNLVSAGNPCTWIEGNHDSFHIGCLKEKSRKTRDPGLARAQGPPMYPEQREHLPIGFRQATAVGDTGQVGDPHAIPLFPSESTLGEHRWKQRRARKPLCEAGGRMTAKAPACAGREGQLPDPLFAREARNSEL